MIMNNVDDGILSTPIACATGKHRVRAVKVSMIGSRMALHTPCGRVVGGARLMGRACTSLTGAVDAMPAFRYWPKAYLPAGLRYRALSSTAFGSHRLINDDGLEGR